MKPYQVEVTKGAKKQLAALPEKEARRIDRRILSLEADPRPPGCKKLQIEQDVYRLRHGDYRIIYQVNDELSVVKVLRVMHRRDVYR
jgi:mRNA interferase RelE/StbE